MPVYEIHDFLRLKFVREDIISDGILPTECRMVVGALPKIGKTTLVTQLALELASGTPFLGLFDVDRPYPVQIIQQELSDEAYYERLILAKPNFGAIQTGFLSILNSRSLQIDTPAGRGEIENYITSWRPRVVIFDPLYKIHSKNEDKASEMHSVLNVLDSLIDKYKVAVILVHHLKKPTTDFRGRSVDLGMSELRGSSSLAAWADSILMMAPHPSTKGDIVLSFWLRHGQVDPVILSPIDGKFTFDAQSQGHPTGQDEQAIVGILKNAPRNTIDHQALVAAVISQTGHSKRAIQMAMSSLRKKYLVAATGIGREKRKVYLLTSPRDQWFLLDDGSDND